MEMLNFKSLKMEVKPLSNEKVLKFWQLEVNALHLYKALNSLSLSSIKIKRANYSCHNRRRWTMACARFELNKTLIIKFLLAVEFM